MSSSPIKAKPKTWGAEGDFPVAIFESFLERERALLSRNTGDPTVGGLRGEKKKGSTRSRLCVDPEFVRF